MENNKAYASVIDMDKSKKRGKTTHEVVIVTRDVPGYMRQSTINHITNMPESEVIRIVDKLNLKHFGLNPEQSWSILASSIKAQNIRDYKRSR